MLGLHYTGYPPLIGLALVVAALLLALRGRITSARRLLVAGSAAIVLSWLVYEIPFLTLDYSLAEVYRNTSPGLPWWLKLAAAWASSGGSLFLFATMVSASALFLLLRREEEPPRLLVTGLPLLVVGGLVPAYLLGAFDLLGREAVSGAGLNPLLKSFWMYPHPLTTFSGYALLSAAALAIISGYRRRGYMLFEVGWALLTLGILIGGYWSYETFGWGGYWAWDPVENGQLMVWLAATLYPHLVVVAPRLRRTVLFFLVATVFLSMYVTRTGLSPLHSFGAPGMGALILLGYTTGFFALSLYSLARESVWAEIRAALEKRTPFHVGMVLASASLAAAALYVFSSLFLPSLMVALGKPVTVPQMSSGIAFYHPVLYPILILLLASLPLALLGDRLGWRGIVALTVTTGVTATVAGLAALMGELVLAPLSPETTNALMAFGLPWAGVAAAAALVDIARRVWRGLGGLLDRYTGIDLLHLGMAVTALGILLSGTYSFNDFYFYEYTLKPGDHVVLPEGITLSLEGYRYAISNTTVDIYTGYAGRHTTYFFAWEGLMALAIDLADVLRAYEEGKKLVEANETIRDVLDLARRGRIELAGAVVEASVAGVLVQRDFAANTTIVLAFPEEQARLYIEPISLTVTVTPQFSQEGGLVGTAVQAIMKASVLRLGPVASPVENANISGVHTVFELRLDEPARLDLGNGVAVQLAGATIVSADLMEKPGTGRIAIVNRTLVVENAYLYLNGTVIVNETSLVIPSLLPRGVAVYAYLSQNPDPYVKAVMESDLYQVLISREKMSSLLSTPECLALDNCFGYVNVPRLVPETAWLELDLRLDLGGRSIVVPVTIRFEAYGEVQGIHGLVPMVVHPIIGLDEVYIVVYPPTVKPPVHGSKTSFHELLVYYLSEVFKQLTPEQRLALAAVMAAGYYGDTLRQVGPQQRPFMLEQVLLELYIAAERFDPANSTIAHEGVHIQVKIVPGVVLVWLGPTLMAVSAVYTMAAAVLRRRLLGESQHPA